MRAKGLETLRFWFDAGPGALGFLKFDDVIKYYDDKKFIEPLGKIASNYDSNEVKKAMARLGSMYTGAYPGISSFTGALVAIPTIPKLSTVLKETVYEGAVAVQSGIKIGFPIMILGVALVAAFLYLPRKRA